MSPRDEELLVLIARCAIRDQAALKSLFDRLGPYLNAVAFRIVRSEDISNDVLQEAFMQIWQNAETYRPHLAKPLTWITSIVRYRALDRLEREQKHQKNRIISEDNALFEEIRSENSPEQDVAADQLRSQLRTCLDLLDKHMKKTIELAYLDGYSRIEIATHLQTNANTVKSWLRRGAERLKLCLETKK